MKVAALILVEIALAYGLTRYLVGVAVRGKP